MTNFCRGWTPNYAEKTSLLQKRIYDHPMAAQDKYAAMFWLRAVVLASLALQSSASIVLCWQPILKVPHVLSALLLQQKISYMSPTRRLSCMAWLVLRLLDVIALPQKLATRKCAARTTGTDAGQQMCRWSSEASCSSEGHPWSQQKKQKQKNHSAKQPDGVWRWQTNKPILPQSLFRYAAFLWHEPTQVSTGGMGQIIDVFTTCSFTNYSKHFCSACEIWAQHNHT